MLFWMLVVVAPLGIAAVLALSVAMGGLGVARLGDHEDARRLLYDHEPDFTAHEVTLALDGHGAIFTGEIDGHLPAIATLTPLGDRFVSRVFRRGDVLATSTDLLGILYIDTADITRRTLKLCLGRRAAPTWVVRVLALTRETSSHG